MPSVNELEPIRQLSIPHHEVVCGQAIGQGGFGKVYQATWGQTPVALKVLDIRGELKAVPLTDFQREATMMMNLRHPRIVALFGATCTPPYWLVLELMSKGALSALLYSSEEISWPLRLQWAQQIVEGLVYLHSKGIVHQDINSMNILLDQAYQAKIADFGLAKLKMHSQSSSNHDNNPAGKLAWIAPEILNKTKSASTKTDMFSYGMLLWELAMREQPYIEANGNRELIVSWAIQGKYPSIPPEVDVPAAFIQLINGCRSAPSTRLTAKAVLEGLTMITTPAPQRSLSAQQPLKQGGYRGGLDSGGNDSQPYQPSPGDYQGALFSNNNNNNSNQEELKQPPHQGITCNHQ